MTMSNSMAAVVQYDLKPGSVEVREMAIPEIGEEEVLLQVGAVSVCGSDVHQYHGSQSVYGHLAAVPAANGQGE